MKQILLSQGRIAIVDDEDYELAMSFNKWNLHKVGKKSNLLYARTAKMVNYKSTVYYLHRIILNNPVGFCIDHIDGNGLNNQKYNLRICSRGDNTKNQKKRINNTSGFKGVWFHKKNQKWISEIRNNNKKYFLGCFKSLLEASKAYDDAALKYHGDFAKLNG